MKAGCVIILFIWTLYACGHKEENKKESSYRIEARVSNYIDSLINSDANVMNKAYAVFIIRFVDYTNIYIVPIHDKYSLQQKGVPLFYKVNEHNEIILYYCGLEELLTVTKEKGNFYDEINQLANLPDISTITDDSFWGIRVSKSSIIEEIDKKEYCCFFGINIDTAKFVPPVIP